MCISFTLALVALLAGHVHAFWIISQHPLISQRLDPILSGSEPSGHVHAFVGSADIVGQDQNKTCTTSLVKADRSRYWAPQLYYYDAAKTSFAAVNLSFVNVYYLNRGDNLTAFPYGFSMIAGNAKNYDAPLPDATAAKAISFVCLNYKSGSSQTQTMPTGPCPDGLRTQINFPACWNGVDLTSSDQSHVSYPTGGFPDSGDCPASHPVHLMTLFYEFIWSVDSYANDAKGTLVLANGDTTGYSFHADFISGWDVTTLQSAVKQCTSNLFGDLKSCPPFASTLKEEVQGQSYCTAKPLRPEDVTGPNLTTLPGCNYIHNGPHRGAGQSVEACPSMAVPTVSSVVKSTAGSLAKPSATTSSTRSRHHRKRPSHKVRHHHKHSRKHRHDRDDKHFT